MLLILKTCHGIFWSQLDTWLKTKPETLLYEGEYFIQPLLYSLNIPKSQKFQKYSHVKHVPKPPKLHFDLIRYYSDTYVSSSFHGFSHVNKVKMNGAYIL